VIKAAHLSEADLEALKEILPGEDPTVIPDRTTGRVIPVAAPRLDGNESSNLNECIRSNWISSAGPFIPRFEKAFANAVGCEFGVSCSSGTAALHLALAALGIAPGDEVIIPTFTMIATANAVSYTGAKPVPVDSQLETWNLDVEAIEAKVTDRTKAIIVVHTYGKPVEMDRVTQIARAHNLFVIEDAAEAHGAIYRDKPIGSLGDIATFSFYANKIITTGEGGMVTTSNPELARLCRKLRDHAFSSERHFWHEYLGFNYRMTDLQAAVGLAQTERFEVLVEARRRNAAHYHSSLKDVRGLVLPREEAHEKNVFWMYGILVGKEFGCSRDALRASLALRGIETRTFFIPIHLQPIYFARLRGQSYPVSELLCSRGMYLPSGSALTPADIDTVTKAIAEVQNSIE
jgi:perosamine synthetase